MSVVMKKLSNPGTRQTVSGSHFLLDITSEDGKLYIKLNPDTRLAELNKQLNESLKESVETKAIRLEAVIHRRTLFE